MNEKFENTENEALRKTAVIGQPDEIEMQDGDIEICEAANRMQPVDQPQIHLSSTDGETVEEATQIVFHKMADGTLFIEHFLNKELSGAGVGIQFQFTLPAIAKQKLKDFLNNEATY